jgi:hypothetical protein
MISDILDPADHLAAHLKAYVAADHSTPFAAVDPIVDRQKDLQNDIRVAVSKGTGFALVIEATEGSPVSVQTNGPALDFTYTITLWTQPVMQAGKPPASVTLLHLLKATNIWKYQYNPGMPAVSPRQLRWRWVEHKQYLVYAVQFSFIHQL